MKKVSVLGLGYIGLPSAIVAAKAGYEVYGYDIDQEKVERINNGDATIVEPEIYPNLKSVLNKSFFASTSLESADCFIVAVPTPIKDKKADISYVKLAMNSIAKVLSPGNLVLLESTVPVGTTEKCRSILEKKCGFSDFHIAYCPERVLPGQIFKELISNDRVIGTLDDQAKNLARLFYKKFVRGTLHFTNVRTSEMVKLVENASRDVEIAFANQVAGMCDEAQINPFEVIDIANKHPRVNILKPGCGVGGHCLAVDPWFLVETFKNSKLIKSSRELNDARPKAVIKKVFKEVREFKKQNKRDPKVLALGLTFKPNVDDYRNSPALEIALELNKKVNLVACEPHIEFSNEWKLSSVSFDVGVTEADIILVLVNHDVFRPILSVKDKVIVDTCGLTYKSLFDGFSGARLVQDEVTDKNVLSDLLLMP